MEGVRFMIDYKDLLERVVSTFIQSCAGMLAVDQIATMNVAEWKLVLGAGAASALSVVKGYLAARFTGDNSCSLLSGKNRDHELSNMYGEE